jgi:hypothetical protein
MIRLKQDLLNHRRWVTLLRFPMSVACTIATAELQHDGKCKNDYKSGAIVFTGGTPQLNKSQYDI